MHHAPNRRSNLANRPGHDNEERRSLNCVAICKTRVAHNVAVQRRYLLGPERAPGLRPMSTHAASPLLVSVGRPGPTKPVVSRTAPQGRAQRSLTPPAMIFDPTDGGRDHHRHGPKGATEVQKRFYHHAESHSQITSPNKRRFTQPLTRRRVSVKLLKSNGDLYRSAS